MNLKTQKVLYGSLIVLLLTIIGTSVYYLLGGFEKATIAETRGGQRSIVGKYFKGYYAHPDLEELWNESRRLVKDGEIPGQLAVVNYANDSLANDEVEQFIGVAISGGMAEVPSDFEVLEIDLSRTVNIFLPMHPLVRPGPHSVEDLLSKFAQDNGLELAPFSLELHFEDNTMTLEVPVLIN